MQNRIAVTLSATALVVTVLGSTSVGRAALDAVVPVPLAKRAYLADTAKNAIKVDNIRASTTPTPGMLLPLDASGKLPASVGAVGPAGPRGEQGANGATKVVVRLGTPHAVPPGATSYEFDTVSCKSGERALNGGAVTTPASLSAGLTVVDYASPLTDGATPTGWTSAVSVVKPVITITWVAYALCAAP